MIDSILGHLEKLVAFETTADYPDHIEQCFDYIMGELAFYPQFTGKPYVGQVANGISSKSYVWGADNLHPQALLYCHIDVVKAAPEFYKMVIADGKAVGRGTYDMKFAVAVYIEVLKKLLSSQGKLPSVSLFLTSDEEVSGMNGTGYLLEDVGYRADVVLMPDGGKDWHIVEEAKGLFRAEITTKGEAGHSSRPWLSTNAIDVMMEVAAAIRKRYPHPAERDRWTTTVNFSRILGGTKTSLNQVADEAQLFLDIRFPYSENPKEELTKIVQGFEGAMITFPVYKSPFFQDIQNEYIQRWKNLIAPHSPADVFIKEDGTADHHYFSKFGIPTIVSQPRGGDIHGDHEFIDIKSLEDYADVVYQFLNAL